MFTELLFQGSFQGTGVVIAIGQPAPYDAAQTAPILAVRGKVSAYHGVKYS